LQVRTQIKKCQVKKYKFCVKQDSSKESIATVSAMSINDAIEYFASVKQMNVDEFNKIFIVEQYD
jgi:excinuclease UvrABC ATPase subunit